MFSFANIRQVLTEFSQGVFIDVPCEPNVVRVKKKLIMFLLTWKRKRHPHKLG